LPNRERRYRQLGVATALFMVACVGMRSPNAAPPVPAAPATSSPLNTELGCSTVLLTDLEARALFAQYCISCHSPNGSASDADFRSAAAVGARRANIEAKLRLHAMPPSDAPQPSDTDRAALRCWARGSGLRQPSLGANSSPSAPGARLDP
jgi:hypothetical protein